MQKKCRYLFLAANAGPGKSVGPGADPGSIRDRPQTRADLRTCPRHAVGRRGQAGPLSNFVANPAGAVIFNAVGSIRQIVQSEGSPRRCCLVVALAATGFTRSAR